MVLLYCFLALLALFATLIVGVGIGRSGTGNQAYGLREDRALEGKVYALLDEREQARQRRGGAPYTPGEQIAAVRAEHGDEGVGAYLRVVCMLEQTLRTGQSGVPAAGPGYFRGDLGADEGAQA